MLSERDKYYTISKSVPLTDEGYPTDFNKVYWRCSDRGACDGTGITTQHVVNGTHGPFTLNKTHSEQCKWNLSSSVLAHASKELIRRVTEDTNGLLDTHAHHGIVVTDLQQHYPDLVGEFAALRSWGSTASRIHTKRQPPLPTLAQLANLHVPPRWATTLLPPFGRWLQHQEMQAGRCMLVLGTDSCFKTLCGMDRAFMDGTFYVCPHPFAQLFIVHYLQGRRMIPALYCLFTGKSSEMYQQFFTWLCAEGVNRGHPVLWHRIRCDFETSLIAGVAASRQAGVLPMPLRLGHCFFHFCQSLYRRVVMEGHCVDYKTAHLKVGSAVRKIMALAFLPPGQIVATYWLVRAEYHNLPPLNALQYPGQQYPNIDTWFDYVLNNYVMDGAHIAHRDAWSVSHLDDFRTNNNLEGYHQKLKQRVRRRCLWSIIEFLQEDARETDATIACLNAGQPVTKQSTKYAAINTELKSLKAGFNAVPPHTDALAYVTNCAYQLKT
jgi:hypothetical protein